MRTVGIKIVYIVHSSSEFLMSFLTENFYYYFFYITKKFYWQLLKLFSILENFSTEPKQLKHPIRNLIYSFMFIFFLIYRVERSKVRVSFFQSSKPQSISPPDSQLLYFGDSYNIYNNNNSLIDSFLQNTSLLSDAEISKMTAVGTLPPSYDRQIR